MQVNYFGRAGNDPDAFLAINIDRSLKLPAGVEVPMHELDACPAEAMGRLAMSCSADMGAAQFIYDYLSRRWLDNRKAAWPTREELLREVRELLEVDEASAKLSAMG